jgi:hypothetical protein
MLPEFDATGDLPPGVHRATVNEVMQRFGSSIFWVRSGMLIDESIDEFIAYWQIKRDGSQRGIVEILP